MPVLLIRRPQVLSSSYIGTVWVKWLPALHSTHIRSVKNLIMALIYTRNAANMTYLQQNTIIFETKI